MYELTEHDKALVDRFVETVSPVEIPTLLADSKSVMESKRRVVEKRKDDLRAAERSFVMYEYSIGKMEERQKNA